MDLIREGNDKGLYWTLHLLSKFCILIREHLFQLAPTKTSMLGLNVLKSNTCSDCFSSGHNVFVYKSPKIWPGWLYSAGSCKFTFKPLCCGALYSHQYCLIQLEPLYLTTFCNPVWVHCQVMLLLLAQKYAVLKSPTHRSAKCLGLKHSPNCICYIMSCLNIAQQQCELVYLWQPWRGQHFFHTFEKSLGGRKWTSRNCCIICTWVGIVSLCELVLQV